MSSSIIVALPQGIRELAHPLTGAINDYDPLLDLVGDSRFVLLGEATHGTHEFYRERALITQRLIREKGFTAVAVEADWPDAFRINQYVRGKPGTSPEWPASALDALSGFERFPQWMWRNTEVLAFISWLRRHNDGLTAGSIPAGFYGLDLYSLYSSSQAVIRYLDKVDPEGARRARYRYSCFEHFGEDTQAYGYAAAFDLNRSCEEQVVSQLTDMQKRAADYASRDGRVAADEFFFAEQNARLVKNAEEYYRAMFRGRVSSWNLRDRHMSETLEALAAHLRTQWGAAKIAVWAHNSHLGDARATEMGEQGEWNVGQLVRERHACDSVLVGFSTYDGTVTAASEWDGPAEQKRVRPGLTGSYEELCHQAGYPQFLITLREDDELRAGLRRERLERAIGVIYRPESERISHYFNACLADQFDALLHFDRTRGVEPLERTPLWERTEEWESYPSGM